MIERLVASVGFYLDNLIVQVSGLYRRGNFDSVETEVISDLRSKLELGREIARRCLIIVDPTKVVHVEDASDFIISLCITTKWQCGSMPVCLVVLDQRLHDRFHRMNIDVGFPTFSSVEEANEWFSKNASDPSLEEIQPM